MKDLEIEVQLRVQKTKSFLVFLKKQAEFIGEKRQVDEYFTPPHRDFLVTRPINEWLRLRSSSSKCSITYKDWHRDKKGKSLSFCDEYQTSVENIKPLKKIFKALNFKSLVVVDKLRRTWTYQNYKISLDKVKGLGNFIEIEYIGKNKKVKPEAALKEMLGFIKEHDCGKIEKNDVGYPFMLLFPEEVRYERI